MRRKGGIYGTGNKAKATRLHSLVVRLPGRCVVCGTTANLQAAHLISRRFNATRTDERAALCLCAKHHLEIDTHANLKMDLIDRTIGRELFNELFAAAMETGRKWPESFWVSECQRLQALLDEADGMAA